MKISPWDSKLKRKLFHKNSGLYCPYCTSDEYREVGGYIKRLTYLREHSTACRSRSKFHNYSGRRVVKLLHECGACGNDSYVYYELKGEPFFVEKRMPNCGDIATAPCPFCGEEPKAYAEMVYTEGEESRGPDDAWWLECCNPKCKSRPRTAQYIGNEFNPIPYWNQRIFIGDLDER